MPDDKISELPLVPSGTPSKATDEAVVNFRNPDGSFTTMRDTFAKLKSFFSGDKENTGVAQGLVDAHVAQSNPHPQYLTSSDLYDQEKKHYYAYLNLATATIDSNDETDTKYTHVLIQDCLYTAEGRKLNGVLNGTFSAKAGQFVTIAIDNGDRTNTFIWAVDKLPTTNSGGGIPEPTTAGNFLRTNTGTWVGGVLKSVYDTFVSATNTSLEQKIDNIWTQEIQDLYPTTGEVALNDTLEEVVNKLNNSKYNGVDSEVIFGGEFLGANKIVYITSPTGQAFLASNTVKNSIKGRLLITNTDIPSSGAGFGVSRGVIISPTALTVGATYVLGQNGDFINIDSIPEQNDIYLKIVGHAISASQLYFNPESDYYELTTDPTLGTVSWSSITGDPSSNTALMALFNTSMTLTEVSTAISSNTLVLTSTNDKDIVTISTTGAITINTITAPSAYFKKEIIFLEAGWVDINASLYHTLKGTFTNGVVNKLTIQKLDNSGKYFLTW